LLVFANLSLDFERIGCEVGGTGRKVKNKTRSLLKSEIRNPKSKIAQ
jgi:hypothetical protein